MFAIQASGHLDLVPLTANNPLPMFILLAIVVIVFGKMALSLH
jgi:hypothetical protein